MIFQITYMSDQYKVKGYLGLPTGFGWTADALQDAIESICGAADLPVTVVAEDARPSRARTARRSPAAAADGAADLPAAVVARDARPAARLPAFMYCRGGVGGFGRVRPHWVDSFAARGVVAFAPCYRGNEGGEGRDEFGGADREDVHAAFRLLQALPFVDAGRISLMGFSRGSINAALTAAAYPETHRLVIWSGVADLARTYEERVDLRRTLKRILNGSPTKRPDAYQERSPIRLAERIRCPALVIHGTNDVQVDVGHGLSLYETFKRLGTRAELHLYQGYGHLLPYVAHEAAIDRMFDWIERAGDG